MLCLVTCMGLEEFHLNNDFDFFGRLVPSSVVKLMINELQESVGFQEQHVNIGVHIRRTNFIVECRQGLEDLAVSAYIRAMQSAVYLTKYLGRPRFLVSSDDSSTLPPLKSAFSEGRLLLENKWHVCNMPILMASCLQCRCRCRTWRCFGCRPRN